VVLHYSRLLGPDDIHPLRRPPRTRTARSLVDAAAWMATDRGAQAVLAAGVQQRLVRVEDLAGVVAGVVARNQRLPRRAVIKDTLDDITGGAGGWTRCGRPPGYRVLRFPAFIVRYHPGYVAGKIRDALTPALI
jgi:hypothetical protein